MGCEGGCGAGEGGQVIRDISRAGPGAGADQAVAGPGRATSSILPVQHRGARIESYIQIRHKFQACRQSLLKGTEDALV